MIKQVFAIEDDVRVQLLYRAMASGLGFELRCAGTLREADGLWREALPDLVILDNGLPDGHGEAVLAWLDGKDPKVPVVVVSGVEGTERAIPGSGRIVARFSKPFDLAGLSEAIRRFARSEANQPEDASVTG